MMKNVSLIGLFTIFIIATLLFFTGCDGGGGSSSIDPESTGTISGSVSGTTILALDDDGMIVAKDNTKGREPDLDLDSDGIDESYSFILKGVPVDMRIRIYLVTNEDVFPMFFEDSEDNFNVFSLSSATGIDIGFIDLGGIEATPEINPLTSADVILEGADADRKRICGATIEDFVGTWKGVVPYSMSNGESGIADVTLILSVSGNQLVGSMESTEWDAVDITGTESGGVFNFDLPNVHPELEDTDCANWDVPFTASLDCSLSKMDLTGGGTFCDISGGKPGTFSGILDSK